ncbi:MAG: NAD(P)H-dependent oxidoreductase [Lachnospiraceae bacterium]|nr:NAD(P)H-dependent oxidoreductase [Lachnospiraceae bacterium]
MSKVLVAYFSASKRKVTEKLAKYFADEICADLFEIKPVEPYSEADLKWMNPLARCNKEKMGNKDVPVEGIIDDISRYDYVFIGFPIWYGAAPNVVNTFCQGYDWTGISVNAFATSGGSGIGKTAEKLRPYVQGASEVNAELFKNPADMLTWAKAIGI